MARHQYYRESTRNYTTLVSLRITVDCQFLKKLITEFTNDTVVLFLGVSERIKGSYFSTCTRVFIGALFTTT